MVLSLKPIKRLLNIPSLSRLVCAVSNSNAEWKQNDHQRLYTHWYSDTHKCPVTCTQYIACLESWLLEFMLMNCIPMTLDQVVERRYGAVDHWYSGQTITIALKCAMAWHNSIGAKCYEADARISQYVQESRNHSTSTSHHICWVIVTPAVLFANLIIENNLVK